MMKEIDVKRMLAVVLLCVILFSGVAYAALIDRGEGLIYDDVLGITLLYDANYANSTGSAVNPDSSGRMHWVDAMSWVNNLVYEGYNDWRLPVASNTSGINEMAYMFYDNLGGSSGSAISASHNANYDLFINLQDKSYASGTESSGSSIYDFNFDNGIVSTPGKNTWFYAWAVRDGDVAPVPEPATLLLFGSGLIGLVGFRKKFKK